MGTDKEKGNILFAIIVFIIFASGIPFALRDEELVRSFGQIPITILGLLIAYFFARGVYRMK